MNPVRLRVLARLGTVAVAALTLHAPARAQNSFSEDILPPRQTTPQRQGQPAQNPAQRPDTRGPDRQSSAPTAEGPQFAAIERIESEDFGVAPVERLRDGPMHAPTPTRIPGGLVITTEALNALYQNSAGTFVVFDVLGGERGLPGAQNALPAAQAGSFSDQTQREFGGYLEQVTGGNKNVPLIFYCQSVYCWMSYNAALRAINLGYTQVLWYRGGIEAWQKAGLQTFGREG